MDNCKEKTDLGHYWDQQEVVVTRESNCKASTGKVLVFWIGSHLWEVVANEVRLHFKGSNISLIC